MTTYPNAGVIISSHAIANSNTPMIIPIQFISFKSLSCFQHDIKEPNPITVKHPPKRFELTVAGIPERLRISNIQAPPAKINDDIDGMRNRTIITKKISPYIEWPPKYVLLSSLVSLHISISARKVRTRTIPQ